MAVRTICIFGPSCSGKSTLGKDLQKALGDRWTYVDRDDLIEQNRCPESDADNVLDEIIRTFKGCLIVDTQLPWREKRDGEVYVRLLPPLSTLLERDEERNQRLGRSAKKAQGAREYVIETYNKLNQEHWAKFDCRLDSSKLDIQKEIDEIKTVIGYRPRSSAQGVALITVVVALSLLGVLFAHQRK